ncbi:MAG: helix-turn-helix domain-containing protein [Phycisphaerae bacterium]
MAKTFYSADEAAERLGKTSDELKELVRGGKLREFRDAGKPTYRVDDIEALAPSRDSAAASASGEIVLEPADEPELDLSGSGSDILSLDEVDLTGTGDTSAGTQTEQEDTKKESTVVPSVGVNVFDDDELDEAVDPLAQTAVTDVAGLGIEGVGSGSGILDLTQEPDDTSLGAELLEEIYTDEEKAGAAEPVEEMGDATRAGIDQAVTEEAEEAQAELAPAATGEKGARPRAVATTTVVEFGPDAVSTSLTALMIVGVVVMWFAGLAGAALVRGIEPAMVRSVYANLTLYAGGSLGVAVVAAGVTFFVVKRSN